MRSLRTYGSVGGLGGNAQAYPAVCASQALAPRTGRQPARSLEAATRHGIPGEAWAQGAGKVNGSPGCSSGRSQSISETT
jgi:hypothetical protein